MNSPEFQLGGYKFVILKRRTMRKLIEIEKKLCVENGNIKIEVLKINFTSVLSY